MTVLESIKSNSQPQYHENEEGAGSAPCSPESDTENILSAPVDSHEKVSNTAPIKETKAQSNRTWWNLWSGAQQLPTPPPTSGAQEQKDLEIVPIQGECLEEVMLALEAKKDIPNDNHQLEEEIDNKPDLGATITQEELSNLTSKIKAIETSQQNFAEGTESWAKDFDEHFHKMEKDLDTIEDNTTKEISALEKRLGHTITNLEQRVKTMEAGLQNMKPKLEAAPSDKEALDRVVTMEENMNKEFSALRTQLESKTNSTEQSLSKLEHQFKILNFDNFLTGLGETQTKVDDLQQSFKDLKLKLETIEESIADMPTALPIANDKQPPTH